MLVPFLIASALSGVVWQSAKQNFFAMKAC